MNICLLNDSFPPVIDGVANVVMNYGRVLSGDHGDNVVVGTPRYPNASYEGYPYRVIPYPSFDTTDFVKGYRTGNPLAIREIAQMAEFCPDIIHTHCPAASTIMARILRRETGTPIIFTYHTKFDVDIARAVRSHFIRKEAAKALVDNIEACDEVWTVSHGAGENLRDLGFTGEYRVVENGVDFPRGRAEEAQIREAVAGYDLPEGVPVYLFVGRLMKYKGLGIILDAMRKLKEDGMDYRMVFIGGGGDEKELQETTAAYGLTDRVFFTGAIHDRQILRAWNTRADLFLFPSSYDTNGIVVREAAACGLASVLIRNSCAAEGITENRNGFVIDENAESLAALLRELGDDIGRMKDAGEHAMNEIYISWDESVRHAYDLYGEVLEKKAALEEENAAAKEALELVAGAGGIVSLAHPASTGYNPAELRRFVGRLAERGLAGIECLYTGYLPNQVEEYVGLAREFGLVVTGGTDFHGDNKPGIRIGVAYGRLRVSVSAFDALEARCAAARQHPTAG